MKAALEELKNIMTGIRGSFVIDEKGLIGAEDLPMELSKKAAKISKLLYYVSDVMKSTREFERIIVDSEDMKLVVMTVNSRLLVVVADKNINLPLLKLVSRAAISKVKRVRLAPRVERIDPVKAERIIERYNKLFNVAAEKLTGIFESQAAPMFNSKFYEVREDHPVLLKSVGFQDDGLPEMNRLKSNAKLVSYDELVAGLEDILVSMLETLKDTAGSNIADKAIDEIIQIKEAQKESSDAV
ncbi:MAG TPA: hypothetical protein ENH13_00580 [Euryarchaeota archaeon]|nr:hypothetical protein BMS3Bbin16_00605 [archaeon BMS3Bbin16]HDH27606.1 hypothetical protein [Euryarchaeota archaeon]